MALTCFRNCGTEIYFDDTKVTKNGKKIPLEMDGSPHRCPMSTYKKPTKAKVGFDYNKKNGYITVGHFLLEKKDFCQYCGLYLLDNPYYARGGFITTDEYVAPKY